jgi:predicted RNA-binding Zn ribbon-like protein
MFQWQHLSHTLGTLVTFVNTSPAPNQAEGLITERTITEVEPVTADEIEQLHTVRRQLRAIMLADDQDRTPLVNEMLARAVIEPRLVDHDALGVHVHYFAPYVSLSEHLRSDCAMALALLVATGESSRLRVCSAPGCSRALVDVTRNRSRTFCDSKSCGNRVHAAAYRARQRTISA